MRDLDENALTEEALRAVSGGSDPRSTQISQALVRHLHALVREIEPTQDEWEAAIDFLTRTGRACTDKRQEFILLSDTLGVSMLVDAINHRQADGATASTVFGPFFVEDRPFLPLGADMSESVEGTPLLVRGTVRSTSGEALSGVTVDCWHSDDDGFYDVQNRDALAMRGAFRCDDEGRFHFWTVRPHSIPFPTTVRWARCSTRRGDIPTGLSTSTS